jgi:Flp pilus assembly protein TadG
MNKRKKLGKTKFGRGRAQAIAEFAIALPILLAILIGIFEVGRYVFIYAGTSNASRNAVRYASAVGKSDGGYTKYNYCYGIKTTAEKSAFLVPVTNVEILYDNGSGAPLSYPKCNVFSATQVDTGVNVSSGNRVTVTVTAEYKPILKLLPIAGRTITSKSSRTILGIIDLK